MHFNYQVDFTLQPVDALLVREKDLHDLLHAPAALHLHAASCLPFLSCQAKVSSQELCITPGSQGWLSNWSKAGEVAQQVTSNKLQVTAAQKKEGKFYTEGI